MTNEARLQVGLELLQQARHMMHDAVVNLNQVDTSEWGSDTELKLSKTIKKVNNLWQKADARTCGLQHIVDMDNHLTYWQYFSDEQASRAIEIIHDLATCADHECVKEDMVSNGIAACIECAAELSQELGHRA